MYTTFIYGLREKGGEIRYVGKANDPNRRFRQHKSNARKEKSHKVSWIQNCLKNKIEIELIILEEVYMSCWQEREIYWISQFNNLTNHDKGGKGGKPIKYKISYEDCKKWIKENLPDINSESKWQEISKNLPEFISPFPRDTYKYRGWISFGDFLSTNKISDKYRVFLDYSEAKEYLKDNFPEIKTSSEYRKYKFPDFIHKKPETKYKKEWIGWGDYLNNSHCKHMNLLNYEDFKNWINNNYPQSKSNKEFKKLIKEDKIPPFIPKKPISAYRNKGWSGWEEL